MAGGTAHGLNPLAVPFVSNEAASTGVKTIRSALPDDGTIAAVVVSVGRLIELPADLLALVIRRLGLSDIERLFRLGRTASTAVEAAMNVRAQDRRDPLPRLPEGETSWSSFLVRVESLRPQPVLAAGDCHCLFIGADGELMSCGVESEHRSVVGHTAEPPDLRIPFPKPIPTMLGLQVRAVAAGAVHSLCVTDQGAVYSWGCSKCGALGHGAVDRQLEPRKIEALAHVYVIGVAASSSHGGGQGSWAHDSSHSLAVSDAGAVFSWGSGKDSRLGHGTSDDQPVPKQIERLDRIRIASVCAGENHSAAVSAVGGVYTWGSGRWGQLGHGTLRNQRCPRLVSVLRDVWVCTLSCGSYHNLALSSQGHVYSWGSGARPLEQRLREEVKLLPPQPVEGLQGCRAIAIAAGKSHNLIVASDGGVYSWGDGSFGKLGHEEPAHLDAPARIGALAGVPVVQVAAGRRHSLAVCADGRAYGWGFTEETLGLRYRQSVPEPQLPAAGGVIGRSLSVCDVPDRQAGPHTTQMAFETVASPALLGPAP